MGKKRKIVLSLLFTIMFVFCIGLLVYSYNLKMENENIMNKYQDFILVSDTDLIDYKNNDGGIKSVILYQNKNNSAEHGVGVIIGNQCYKIAVYSNLNENMHKGSKIISIKDNEIIFNSIFDNLTQKMKLIMTKKGADIHFQVIDL